MPLWLPGSSRWRPTTAAHRGRRAALARRARRRRRHGAAGLARWAGRGPRGGAPGAAASRWRGLPRARAAGCTCAPCDPSRRLPRSQTQRPPQTARASALLWLRSLMEETWGWRPRRRRVSRVGWQQLARCRQPDSAAGGHNASDHLTHNKRAARRRARIGAPEPASSATLCAASCCRPLPLPRLPVMAAAVRISSSVKSLSLQQGAAGRQ